MSNQEQDRQFIFRISQIAEYIVEIERRLDSLTEQFNNRPELQQLSSLQNALTQLHRQFNERPVPAAPVEVVNQKTEAISGVDEIQQQLTQVQSYENQLVFDRSGSRAVLMEALEKAQQRLIVVSPWLNRNSIDANLMQKFRDCLNRNCRIDIGWGYLSDRSRLGKGWRYDALKDLRQLERDYPDSFRLKLLGTHEKFLVCDSTFAMLGSHNFLTSSAQSAEREVGIRTTDPHIIKGLIDRFDGAYIQDAQAIDESITAGLVLFDDVAVLAAESIGEEVDVIFRNLNEGEQDPAIDAEVIVRRYREGERDFTGVNLTGVNLTSANLRDVSLTEANLSGATLNNANLQNAKLLQANMNSANLNGAVLLNANLIAANLRGANLIKADLRNANLTASDLSKAKLTNALLDATNLSGANLMGINLVGANLQNLYFIGANLTGANLCGVNLSSNESLSGINLTSADLRGENLEKANLERANLKGANLNGAILKEAKLSGAIMPDGTVHD